MQVVMHHLAQGAHGQNAMQLFVIGLTMDKNDDNPHNRSFGALNAPL